MTMSDPVRIDRIWKAIERIADPARRQEAKREMRIAERAHEQAMLEDMGYDDCDVCRANRLREAWRA